MGDYVLKFTSLFVRATGDRDWHANITSPRTEQFEELDLLVTARGANTTRFFPYAIKSGTRGGERWFSFNFKDGGDTPFDGTGDEITLFCTLHYAVPK